MNTILNKFKQLDFIKYTITPLIFILIIVGVTSNVLEQRAIDKSKLPEDIELNKNFQRWITNIKNNDLDIEADDFRLKEETEIYNTKWMTVKSLDQEGIKEEFEQTLNSVNGIKKVVFSPSEREFIDYRDEVRGKYLSNEVHFYGLKEDKVIDARILDCSIRANCYFDRAYFIDNDVFVISEISRDINKKDPNTIPCEITDLCTYTYKVHIIDLINNQRLIYESKPFEIVLSELKPEL